MDNIFNKLRLKPDHRVLVLNAPKRYLDLVISSHINADYSIDGKYDFVQYFETVLEDAEKSAKRLIDTLSDDGLLWVCYPKGSSKNIKSDINRTKIWGLFGAFGFEPVSQVSIDADWSAIRYRHVDKIKSLTRKNAATDKGKLRVKKNKQKG